MWCSSSVQFIWGSRPQWMKSSDSNFSVIYLFIYLCSSFHRLSLSLSLHHGLTTLGSISSKSKHVVVYCQHIHLFIQSYPNLSIYLSFSLSPQLPILTDKPQLNLRSSLPGWLVWHSIVVKNFEYKYVVYALFWEFRVGTLLSGWCVCVSVYVCMFQIDFFCTGMYPQ